MSDNIEIAHKAVSVFQPVSIRVPRIPLNAVDLPYLIEKNVITLAEARQLLGFTE